MAAMSRRGCGRPSASFSRSSIERAGSCQGASSSASCGPVAGATAVAVELAAPLPPPPCRFSRPAKKPLSHARCAGVKGAVSGNTGIATVMYVVLKLPYSLRFGSRRRECARRGQLAQLLDAVAPNELLRSQLLSLRHLPVLGEVMNRFRPGRHGRGAVLLVQQAAVAGQLLRLQPERRGERRQRAHRPPEVAAGEEAFQEALLLVGKGLVLHTLVHHPPQLRTQKVNWSAA